MKLRALDALRGLAALYVVVFHAVGLLWAGASEDAVSPVVWVVRNVFGHGQQAVLLFFVISGFCIHYRQAQTGATSVQLVRFAWRRFRRLYPPLLLALTATALFDWFGHQFNTSVYEGASTYRIINAWVISSYSPETLIGNLLFQARLMVPAFGTDGPLWSLAFEFWFYALYPLTLLLFRQLGVRTTLVAIAAISGTAQLTLGVLLGSGWDAGDFIVGPLNVLFDWPVWIAGAAIAEGYARGLQPAMLKGPRLVLVLGLGVVVSNSPVGSYSDLGRASLLALGVAYLMFRHRSSVGRLPLFVSVALRRLGDISYSLYLLHFPFFVLLAAWWTATRSALPEGLELTLVGVGSALVLGWIGWYAVERHCVPGRGVARPAPSATRVQLRGLATPSEG